jgi:hypothetical protein
VFISRLEYAVSQRLNVLDMLIRSQFIPIFLIMTAVLEIIQLIIILQGLFKIAPVKRVMFDVRMDAVMT